MPIAPRLERHLASTGLSYGLVPHAPAATSSESAGLAGVPRGHLAKSVLISREDLPLLAVIPADRRIDLDALELIIHNRVDVADEGQLRAVFEDCRPGAVPCVGAAYGLETVIDPALMGLSRVWFQAGDHETLVEMEGDVFERLMRDAERRRISTG